MDAGNITDNDITMMYNDVALSLLSSSLDAHRTAALSALAAIHPSCRLRYSLPGMDGTIYITSINTIAANYGLCPLWRIRIRLIDMNN